MNEIPMKIRELITQNKVQNSKLYNGERKDINIKLQHLNKIDFSKQDLSNLYFYNCIIEECQFRKANLNHCVFIECTIIGNNFSDSELVGARFERCSITFNNMRNVDLSNTRTILSIFSNNAGVKSDE